VARLRAIATRHNKISAGPPPPTAEVGDPTFHVVGLLSVGAILYAVIAYLTETRFVAWRLIVNGTVPKPPGFQDEFSLFDTDDRDKLGGAAKLLFVLLGPRCIGKTDSMQSLQSALRSPALFMEYHFDPQKTFFAAVAGKLRQHAMPLSPSPSQDLDYIEQVFAQVRRTHPDFLILIDIQRAPTTQHLAVELADQLRTLQRRTGCNVVCTTSEVLDFLASKAEPRRVVKLCGELPLDWCVKRGQQLKNEGIARGNVLGQMDAGQPPPSPMPKRDDPLPDRVMRTLKTSPRNWIEVKKIVKRGGDTDSDIALRYSYQVAAIMRGLNAAKCPHNYRPLWSEKLTSPTGKIDVSDVLRWCNSNPDAPKVLMAHNVLRPVMREVGGADDVVPDVFAWQYQYYSEVVELMPQAP
jgi:hypothetical protein